MPNRANGGRLRSRIITVALATSLVGGTAGIEVFASHLTSDTAVGARSAPVPAAVGPTTGAWSASGSS
jgi:hypothetical protein